MQQIIDVASELGEKFVQQLNKNFPVKKQGEKTREIVKLSPEQLDQYPFLNDVIGGAALKEMDVKIKSVEIGNYGRKVAWTSRSMDKEFFRIVIHFGNPEAYYYNDNVYALMPGYGFILTPWTPSEVQVNGNAVQVFNHEGIQRFVPKIRPRNYLRTTLVYNLSIDLRLQGKEESENIEDGEIIVEDGNIEEGEIDRESQNIEDKYQ